MWLDFASEVTICLQNKEETHEKIGIGIGVSDVSGRTFGL